MVLNPAVRRIFVHKVHHFQTKKNYCEAPLLRSTHI